MFSETFEIAQADRGTRLCLAASPLDKARLSALKTAAARAIEEIKSLAAESAQIHRPR